MNRMKIKIITCIIIVITVFSLFCVIWKVYSQQSFLNETDNIKLENIIWERELYLDDDGRVKLHWNFTKEDITMLVIGRTTGYIGVGFTHTLDMVDSDIVVGWVTDGKIHLKDLYGVKNGIPIEDSHHDYHLLFGGENETHTWFCFNRKLNTNDFQDISITTSTFHIIWAMNERDVLNSELTEFDYHGNKRGMKKVMFLFLSGKLPSETEDIEAFDIRLKYKRIQKMSSKTPYNYYCKLVKVPNFGEIHHLIGAEVALSPMGEKFVHHMNVYACEPGISFDVEMLDYRCYVESLADVYCVKPIAGGTFGQTATFIPEHFGIPFGSTDNQPMYLRMDVHYALETVNYSFIDNSGMRLYHTRKLRPFSVGSIALAVKPMYVIPPKALSFSTYAIASPKCTKALLPKEGVHIVGMLLHSHNYVEKVIFYHFRNNIEINRISEEHFDFSFQRMRWLKEEILVLQNDMLVYECVHNTTGRNTSMYSFAGSDDDMCVLYGLMYPEITYSIFLSGLAPKEQHKFFNKIPDISAYEYDDWFQVGLDMYHSLGTVFYAMDHNWTEKEINDYRNLHKYGQHSAQCHFERFNTRLIYEELRLPNISSV